MQNFVLFTFLFISAFNERNAHLPERPKVAIELENAGMHRDLTYVVQFDYPLAGNECEYILEQSLPSGTYIDTDQLDDLRRLKKLNALYPEFVNIEIPAEKAEKFKILLIGKPTITATIKLPIHLRYHAPQHTDNFVHVDIEPPKMFMNCLSNDIQLIEPEMQLTPGKTYCLDKEDLHFISVTPLSTNNCQWQLINIDLQQKGALKLKVPVGNANFFKLVLYATIILSWIVSIWLAIHTYSVPQRINHKLQEQRVLQNKVKSF